FVAGSARGFQEMLDPRSIVYRAFERASQNTGRLPRADAALVRVMQLFGSAQLAEARRLADSVAMAESDNVNAIEIAAILYSFSIFINHSHEGMTADV